MADLRMPNGYLPVPEPSTPYPEAVWPELIPLEPATRAWQGFIFWVAIFVIAFALLFWGISKKRRKIVYNYCRKWGRYLVKKKGGKKR